MSEDNLLVINTETEHSQPAKVDPLPLYDDKHPMLSKEISEYATETLPNPSMDLLVKRLRMTMKKFGGIGLSANQCGVFERVFIIGTDDFEMVCINPKVLKVSDNIVKENEGCLSFPGLYIKIPRNETIDVEYTTEKGEVKKQTLTGITARCYLHEYDHMYGVKFTDHVGPTTLRLAKQKQQKMIKKIQRQRKR